MDDLTQQQSNLTRYLRDPDNQAPPADMDLARVNVYRDLVFNNLLTLLGGTFPVLIRIIGDERWRTLVRDFLREHRAQTPKFGEIAEEFLGFLATESTVWNTAEWPPFLLELAHYEWVEMLLQQSAVEALPPSDPGLLLERPLQMSSLAWPLSYVWPVHLLAPDHQPTTPPLQQTFLLMRRMADWNVKFSELSPLAWRLLQRIEDDPQMTGRWHLQALADEAGWPAQASFFDNGLALLQQMHEEGVIGIAV